MLKHRISCGSWMSLIVIIAVAAIACEAKIVGNVKLGNGNDFIKPFLIDAGSGQTILGNGNNLEAGAAIINESCGLKQIIGIGNIFHANTTCKSLKVGNGNIMKPGSSIGEGIVLGNGCTVHAGCHKRGNIVYGNGACVTCP